MSLSTDGHWALTGSMDQTVRLWEVASGRCLHIFERHTSAIGAVHLSADGRWVCWGSGSQQPLGDMTVRLWECDWELEAHEPVDWDESAKAHLEMFLSLHTPYMGGLPHDREPSEQHIQRTLTRRGRPVWNEEDFQFLLRQLQYAGYGWLRPEGIRRKLEEMVATWQGPSP